MGLRIQLSQYNERGIIASVVNDSDDSFGDDLEVFKSNASRNAKRACVESAARLRKLADAFQRLAAMPDPFKTASQRAAMKSQGANQ